MIIIGCDYHPGFQQIAFVDTDTGELSERRLGHKEQAEQFYRELRQHGMTVRVGMEASGHARWFERLLSELQFELWIGDAAEIRTKRVRKQKTDRQDAQLLLRLLLEDRFPQIWVPDAENRDLRQLLWHRHRLVQMRTRVMNQLHVVALNEGLRRKKALWRPAGRAELEVDCRWLRGRAGDGRTCSTYSTGYAEDPGTDAKAGTGGGEAARDAATEDASRSGSVDRTGVRVGDRNAGTFSLRQTDRQLSWGWCRRKSPAEIGGDWDTSASRATCCCGSCWWKRRRSRCAAIRNGAASSFTWPCGVDGRSRRSRWRGNWRSSCTGCGGAAGITSKMQKARFAGSKTPPLMLS